MPRKTKQVPVDLQLRAARALKALARRIGATQQQLLREAVADVLAKYTTNRGDPHE